MSHEYERTAVGAGESGIEQAEKYWRLCQQKTNELFERANRNDFDVAQYAKERRISGDWVTVEIGPGIRPSGLNRTYTGGSAYIALESQRNLSFAHYTPDYFNALKANRPDENIFMMIDTKIGRDIEPDSEEGMILSAAARKRINGKSDTDGRAQRIMDQQSRYLLPSDVADEVFVVYTLDDPLTKTGLVISEASRILKPGGKLIIYDKYNNAAKIAEELEDSGMEPLYAQMESAWSAYDDFADDTTSLYKSVAAPLGCYRVNNAPDLYDDNDLIMPDMVLIASKPIDNNT